MRVIALVVIFVSLGALGSPDVAAALQKLESARTTLSQAVQRVEVEPPATADLDAAHAAVEALKAAIDSGAALESEDLDYAKAALAARKEVRTHRDYVDGRRAKVHIFNHRRTIDAALAALKERGEKDFEEARAAASALKKALDDGRQFTSQDAKFASYVAEADATLARQQKAIDDRWTAAMGEKHRALVEESRQALSTAMATLGKGSTDAQFEAVDRAMASLASRLNEGKPLEANDKAYRAYAESTRKESAAAKKKMDELWSETGFERLKAEIEPAYQDLLAAGKVVKMKKPPAEQLAEARTLAIVVRKLVDKFQPEASRSAAFGLYVKEVKERLVEFEVQLQLKDLEAASKDVTAALRQLERRAPTDEHFEEAKSALLILEKTLLAVHTKDPVMAGPAADAKAMLRDARAAIAKRRLEVDIDRQKLAVEEARKKATALVTQIQKANVELEQIQNAETAVQQIGAALETGAGLLKKNAEYAAYDREVKQRIAELNGKIASRKILLDASEGRAQLNEALSAAKAKLDAAKQPLSTDADLEAATQALAGIIQVLEARIALEPQDRGYAAHADRARLELVRFQEALGFATQARALRRSTAEALSAGLAAAQLAASSDSLRAQKAQYEKALSQYKVCKDEAATIEGSRQLANVALVIEGRTSTPKEVIALCSQKYVETTQLVKPLVGLIAFDEGPKRSFETAKGLLAKGQKTEALAAFDDCTASGITLQYRNPEFKERQFEVAGAQMTLNEVTRQCSDQGKSLRGK